MAVTKQTYSLASNWTASQLADTFKQAFIDAGWMTDWHDSFVSSGIENRILRIIYDGSKTYGTTYYWFMFTTGGIFVNPATGWNTTTKQPVGTQYLDYWSTATNVTTNHYTISSLSSTLIFELYRLTSSINQDFSWFYFRNGSTVANFSIPQSSAQVSSWIDLNKTVFHHILIAVAGTSVNSGIIYFSSRYLIRRSFLLGAALVNWSGFAVSPNSLNLTTASYMAVGKASISSNNPAANLGSAGNGTSGSIVLPIGVNATNPAYSSDYNPVFYGLPVTNYLNNFNIPSDFGIVPHYAANTMQPSDKFIVTSGVEEWEIIVVSNNATITTGCSMAFAARIL